MTASCVMVLGTTSGAGKSWLTTALCRHYARAATMSGPGLPSRWAPCRKKTVFSRTAARPKGGEPHLGCHRLPTLDTVFEGLAEFVEQHFEPGFLKALIA